jgi:hypothetical protein
MKIKSKNYWGVTLIAINIYWVFSINSMKVV